MTNDRLQLVHELFDAVVDASPERREALLAERCAGDTELMAAVRSLLRHDEAHDSFLDPPVESALAGFISQEMASDLLGTLVGPYRITRLIASGGMGTVYHAVRADGDEPREVAVKVIREGMLAPDMVKRFERERTLLGSLRHASVASFIDAGVTSEGCPYLVMEYIDGEAIDAYCDGHMLTIQDRVRLLVGVCRAVTYAHGNLLVHRDIKPSNILVTRAGVPKLLDFGIAKLIPHQSASAMWTQTATDRRIVTPQYASPEVMRGEPVSTAMDVYSLGLVLFELLTGRRPYDVTNRSAGSAEQLICELEPSAPSVVAVRQEERVSATGTRAVVDLVELARLRGTTPQELRRVLRGDLDTVVLTALHKDTARRYQSVEQLASDLERHLTGFPILARKDSLVYGAVKFYNRHRLGVVMGGVALLSLFVGVAGVVYGYVSARRETQIAQLEAFKASEINGFLHEMLAAADPEDGRTDVTVREVLDVASDRLEAELSTMPEVRAALHQTIGETYVNLGLQAEAEPHLRQAVRMRRVQGLADSAELCQSMLALGRTLRLAGGHEEAERVLGDALGRSRRLGPKGLPLEVQCLIALGRAKEDQGNFSEAELMLREALDTGRRTHGERHRDVAEAMERLGMVLSSTGRKEAATKLCRQALAINQSLFGAEHVRVSNSLRRLAVVLHEQFRYEEAETLYRESLAMHRALFGEDHPEVARVLNNLGWLLFVTGRRDAGREMLSEALAIRRRIFGNEHAAVATTLNNLAATLEASPAEPLLRESLALSEGVYGPRHFSVGRTSQNLATCLKNQGKLAEAEPLYRRAVAIMRESLGPAHPSVAYALFGLADVLVQRGAADEAELLLHDCIAIPTGGGPANEALKASALRLVGGIETNRGDFASAETHLLEAYGLAETSSGAEGDTAAYRQSLVALYEAWGRPELAEAYRTDPGSDPDPSTISPD